MVNSTSSQFIVNAMSVQQQPNVFDWVYLLQHLPLICYMVICLQMFHASMKKYENTCLFVYNKVRSHHFQGQVEKLARQEVLCTIQMFIVLAGNYILKKILKRTKVILWHSVVLATISSIGSVCLYQMKYFQMSKNTSFDTVPVVNK